MAEEALGQLVCNSNRWSGRYLNVSESYFVKSSILLFKEKLRREKRKEKRKWRRKERKSKMDDQIPARVVEPVQRRPSISNHLSRRLGVSGQRGGCWRRHAALWSRCSGSSSGRELAARRHRAGGGLEAPRPSIRPSVRGGAGGRLGHACLPTGGSWSMDGLLLESPGPRAGCLALSPAWLWGKTHCPR